MFGSAMMMAAGGGLNVDDVFATTLFTYDGTTNRLISTPFDPDLAWIKPRAAAVTHVLMDAGRGNNYLSTNTTDAQLTLGAGFGDVRPGGFYQAGSGSSVGWAFAKAPKFYDRVPYTGNGVAGRQIAHDLGVKPGMIVVKATSTTASWIVYHQSRGATKALFLDLTNAETTTNLTWNNTEPDATTFTVAGASTNTNNTGTQYVAYLFAHDPDPDGIIQCGQYVGNGNNPGATIPLPWEAQWLLVKNTQATGNWIVVDNKRPSSNPRDGLLPNSSGSESVFSNNYKINLLTNGFQPVLGSETNGLNNVMIYVAIRKGAA